MLRPSHILSLIIVVALTSLAIGSHAQTPVITGVSPQPVAGGIGATITVSGTGFGSWADVVEFPGTMGQSPVNWGSGWVEVAVPATWSGQITVHNGLSGLISAGFPFELSYASWGINWVGTANWFMNQTGAPGCSVANTQDRLQKAVTAWACASGLSASYAGTTALSSLDHNDGVSVHGWITSSWDTPGLIASAIVKYHPTTMAILEADVSYNGVYSTWSCNGDAGDMDVQNVATHEFGHCIGFGDLYGVADQGKTMFGNVANGQTAARSLSVADALGAEHVYPHAGRANLTYGTPSGWYGPIVPRDSNDASSSYAPLPAILGGNSPAYVNFAQTNNGLDCAGSEAWTHLYLDEKLVAIRGWSGNWGTGHTDGWTNLGSTVRGGRHTFTVEYDVNSEIVESNEFDNQYVAQFAWTPYGLADQVPVTRSAPPPAGFLPAVNCEAFQFTGNWWGAVGIAARNAGDDYDLRLYDDYSGSTVGYQTTLAQSAASAGETDFVLVNGNILGFGETLWAGVTKFSSSTTSDVVVHQSNQVGAILNPSMIYGELSSTGTVTIGSDQILKVHEVYLGDTNASYGFYLDRTAGTGRLSIGLMPSDGAYLAKNSALVISQQDIASQELVHQPITPGYYAVVVWKYGSANLSQSIDYELRVGRAISNLDATVIPSGFSSPVVPRNSPGAGPGYAPLPAILNGPDATIYLTWSVENVGPSFVPPFTTQVFVDDELFKTQLWPGVTEHGPGPWSAYDSPVTMRGGRHSVMLRGDAGDNVFETDEGDNIWTGQWVFEPLPLPLGTAALRAAPPLQGSGAIPNCDGIGFHRNISVAWVVGLAANNPLDDYDLYTYSDYSGSQSGFSALLEASIFGGLDTDFVVGHYSAGPADLYAGAVNYSAGAGADYVFDAHDAVGREGSTHGFFPGQVLDENRIVDVYEAYLPSGMDYRFRLTRTAGSADLSFAVFNLTTGGIAARGEQSSNSLPVNADVDELLFSGAADEWFPIVVYRPNGSDLLEVEYEFMWEPDLTAAPIAGPGFDELRIAGVFPNPLSSRSRLAFELPAEAPVIIDLFDARGRRVRRVANGLYPAGRHEVMWDGRDQRGDRVAAGRYFLRLDAGGSRRSAAVVVLR